MTVPRVPERQAQAEVDGAPLSPNRKAPPSRQPAPEHRTQRNHLSPDDSKPNQTKLVHRTLRPLLPHSSSLSSHILESSRPTTNQPTTPSPPSSHPLLCPHLIIHTQSFGLHNHTPNSIALDVHVPSWSINRINHRKVVCRAQLAADSILPIAEVHQSSRR